MELTSGRFGTVPYKEEEIITFEEGLCGFPDLKYFLLRRVAQTEPICWLLSTQDGSVCFPLLRPELLCAEWSKSILPIADATTALGCCKKTEARLFCIAVLPRDLTQITLDLRAPLLINPRTKKGLQYSNPGVKRLPVRRPVYRELKAYLEGQTC